MARKILVAIASELDGHAGASAIQATIPSINEEHIRKFIIDTLTYEGDDDCEVIISRVTQSKEVWYVYGTVYDMEFSAIVAPAIYTHIETRTG